MRGGERGGGKFKFEKGLLQQFPVIECTPHKTTLDPGILSGELIRGLYPGTFFKTIPVFFRGL